jgi:hypothetical protein
MLSGGGSGKYLVFKFFKGTNKQANRDREEDNEGKHTSQGKRKSWVAVILHFSYS